MGIFGLGAFGAHGLKNVLEPGQLTTFTTGVTYHFNHNLALFVTIVLIEKHPSNWFRWASICFILGIILFSGSLCLLATRELIGLENYKWLGPITPIGGVFFILAWCMLSIGAVEMKDK